MSTPSPWIKLLFWPWLWIIGFFYRSYTLNRERLARFMARPWVSIAFKGIVVVTFLGWIAIWLLASDENRERLTETVKEQLRDLELWSGE
jgi:uncharacterized membrane protein (DUF106 family)